VVVLRSGDGWSEAMMEIVFVPTACVLILLFGIAPTVIPFLRKRKPIDRRRIYISGASLFVVVAVGVFSWIAELRADAEDYEKLHETVIAQPAAPEK
jgi:hypothetical protein